jgi:hypothetical protein
MRSIRWTNVELVDRAELAPGDPAVVWKDEARLDKQSLDLCEPLGFLERLLLDVSKIVGQSRGCRWMGVGCPLSEDFMRPRVLMILVFVGLMIAPLVLPVRADEPAVLSTLPFDDIEEVDSLTLLGGEWGTEFGWTVALDGDTAVVGATGRYWGSPDSAFVFVRDAFGEWTQQARLMTSDWAVHDHFGDAIAIDGDTVVIGAWGNDGNSTDSGSAYVFVRNAFGEWTEQAKLLASDGRPLDGFGWTVALDGDTVVIGAWTDGDTHWMSGSAYVFVRDAFGQWTERAKLLASDGQSGDLFGCSVAIDGDTVVIGALGDDGSTTGSGSAYVFVRDTFGQWTERAKLLASDGQFGDYFGGSVAIDGDTVVIGALGDDTDNTDSGSAYIFVREAFGEWTERSKLLASDGQPNDHFGRTVALDGDAMVIGPVWTAGFGGRAAYLFVRGVFGEWTEVATVDQAFSVAIDGNIAVIGANGQAGVYCLVPASPFDLVPNIVPMQPRH